MATVLEVQQVFGEDGVAYKRDTDWTDDGAGSIAVVPASDLATYIAGAGAVTIQRSSYSNTPPAGPFTHILDGDYSGVRKIAAPDTAWASGTAVAIAQESLHVIERVAGGQSSIQFGAWADDSSAQGLNVGDYVAVRLGTKTYAGAVEAQYEWRGVVVERGRPVSTKGERQFSFLIHDFTTLIREQDVAALLKKVPAYLITIPGETGGPPQTTLGGVQDYKLSKLVSDIKPTGVNIHVNAPDVQIERLPSQGDAYDYLVHVLNATGFYAVWEVWGSTPTLVIEPHDATLQTASTVITDSIAFEIDLKVPQRRKQYTRVEIRRPESHADRNQQAQPPGDLPPQGVTGAFAKPGYQQMVEGEMPDEETVYRIALTWVPPQRFIEQEPGPIYFAFGDPKYNISGRSSAELYTWLKVRIANMRPSTRYTDEIINNYFGLDHYFMFQPDSAKIRSNNDFADGWVVSRAGWLGEAGSISAHQIPVANAVVVLRGLTTGVVYTTRTNAAGYYKVENAAHDEYSPTVYLDDDSYLANKNDQYSDGHPYDDDPANDETGPDTSLAVTDLFQIFDTDINFIITAHIPSLSNSDPTADFHSADAYNLSGTFGYGDNTGDVKVISPATDLVVDTANITTDLQARQFAEKDLDRQEEDATTIVITKPFGGQATRAGQVVKAVSAEDAGLTADARVIVREVSIRPGGVLLESLSTDADSFTDEYQKYFAQQSQVERTNTVVHEMVVDLQRQVDRIFGLLPRGDQSGVS